MTYRSAKPWPRFGPPLSPEGRRAIFCPEDAPPDPFYPYELGTRSRRKQPISLRMDPWILDLVKAMAHQHLMPYQQLLRMLIAEGLTRAMREGMQERDQGVTDWQASAAYWNQNQGSGPDLEPEPGPSSTAK